MKNLPIASTIIILGTITVAIIYLPQIAYAL